MSDTPIDGIRALRRAPPWVVGVFSALATAALGVSGYVAKATAESLVAMRLRAESVEIRLQHVEASEVFKIRLSAVGSGMQRIEGKVEVGRRFTDLYVMGGSVARFVVRIQRARLARRQAVRRRRWRR